MIQDLLIIGGGIHGASIAREAAMAGLKVTLCEKHDLASGTSSMSSKLIHGGLRYLEQYAFRLVKESLRERETLMHLAPHLVQKQRFIIPHSQEQRPFWLLEVGLYLYDKLSNSKILPKSSSISLDASYGLKPNFYRALSYYDCTGDDARMVVLNALAASQYGANILLHHECLAASIEDNLWSVSFKANNLNTKTIKARMVINATGIYADQLATNIFKVPTATTLSLVKGSHIVIKRPFTHKDAFLIQNADKRVVFVIPYLKNHTLIGTTDVLLDSIPSNCTISVEETNYLLAVYNNYFKLNISSADIVQSYAGIRPLSHKKVPLGDGQSASSLSRDYIIELQATQNPPIINIFGGKLTTYRKLTQKLMNIMIPFFKPLTLSSKAISEPLPGGDLNKLSVDDYILALAKQYPEMPFGFIQRLGKTYGSLAPKVLGNNHSFAQLGIHFGATLTEVEINYLIKYEWAKSVDDILERRTKLAYFLSAEEIAKITNWLSNRRH